MIAQEIQDAQTAFRAGNVALAKQKIDSLHAEYPTKPEVRIARAIILAASGDGSTALSLFRQILTDRIATDDSMAWAARLAIGHGDYLWAEQFARRFVELQPNLALSHYLLASALQGQGRIPEGLAEVDRALAINPKHIESLVTKARLLQAWNLHGTAEDVYKQALSLAPHPGAAIDLAALYLSESRPEEALHLLRQAESQMPTERQPHRALAEALTQLRRFDEADHHWQLAARQTPNPTFVWQGRAMAEVKAGRFDRAIEQLRALIDTGVDVSVSFGVLARAKKITEDDRALVDQMSALSSRKELSDPMQADLDYALGKAFDDLSDYERAIGFFDRANQNRFEALRSTRNFTEKRTRHITDYFISKTGPEFVNRPVTDAMESEVPLFVVGMMRSGTTLTESILSAHSQVRDGGEQAFWAVRGMYYLDPSHPQRPIDVGRLVDLGRQYLASSESRARGARHIVDKYPMNFYFLGFLHPLYPNVKFIHLKRHPVDNLMSLWMTPMSPNIEYANDRRNLVIAYRAYERLMQHYERVIPANRLLTVSYEALTSNPDPTIASMASFVGLQMEPAMLHPELSERTVITPSVFQVRQPINVRSQGRWRNYEPWLGEFAELLSD